MTKDEPLTQLVKSYGIRAYACHPLLGPNEELLGTLSFGGTRTRDTFSEEDLSLMKAVAEHVAVALIRAMSVEAMREAQALAEGAIDIVHHPLVVLDDKFRVGLANRPFYDTFQMTKKDTQGKQIYELADRQWDIPPLHQLLERILAQDTPLERCEICHEFVKVGKCKINVKVYPSQFKDHWIKYIILSLEPSTT